MKRLNKMGTVRTNIAIIEPSQIVVEGLSNALLRSGQHYQVFKIDDIEEVTMAVTNYDISIIIVNPSQIQNRQPFPRLRHFVPRQPPSAAV